MASTDLSTRERLRRLLAEEPGLTSEQLAARLERSPQRIRQLLPALGAIRGWALPKNGAPEPEIAPKDK